MAVNLSNWYSNAIVGTPQVGADVDIYEVSSNAKFAVGTGFERSDGSVFRYSHFGGVLHVSGLLCSQDFSESGTAQSDSRGTNVADCTQLSGQQFDVNTTGSYYVQVGFGNISADRWAGGYLLISKDDSALGVNHQGHTYRIKGNTASGTPAAQKLYIELYSPLQGTVGSTSDISICGSLYANLESATAQTDTQVAGVNVSPILTADSYGWVQTKGPVGIQADASYPATAGDVVTLSDTDTGQCTHASEAYIASLFHEPIIGYCIDPGGADNEFAFVNLNL